MSNSLKMEEQKRKLNREKTILKLHKSFYLALTLCLAYIIQDIFTRDEFFNKSNEVTLHVMQNTGQGYEWFNRRISTVSMLADAAMIAYVFWITPRQIDGLYLIICTCLSLFQMTFLKSLYQDPRPYFVNLEIKTSECGPEFGNPSGHGVNNLVLVYVSHYIADNDCFSMIVTNAEGKRVLHQRRFWINFIGIILCIIIGWARVCLGMHSLNQVLLGWVLGIVWIIFYLFVFYKRYRFYWSDVIQEVGFTRRKQILLGFLLVLYAFIMGMCVLVYEMSRQHFEIPEMWILGIVQTCKKPFDSDMFHRALYHKTFTDMGVFGATFGIFIAYIFVKGNYNEQKLTENYAKASKKIILLRVVSDIVLLAIFFGIPWASVQFIGQEHVYPRFFIGFNLASFLAGAVLVLIRARFFKLFKCQLEGDLNYEIANSSIKTVVLLEDVQQDPQQTNENSNQCTPLKDKSDNQVSSNSKFASPDTIQIPISEQGSRNVLQNTQNRDSKEMINTQQNLNVQSEPPNKCL